MDENSQEKMNQIIVGGTFETNIPSVAFRRKTQPEGVISFQENTFYTKVGSGNIDPIITMTVLKEINTQLEGANKYQSTQIKDLETNAQKLEGILSVLTEKNTKLEGILSALNKKTDENMEATRKIHEELLEKNKLFLRDSQKNQDATATQVQGFEKVLNESTVALKTLEESSKNHLEILKGTQHHMQSNGHGISVMVLGDKSGLMGIDEDTGKVLYTTYLNYVSKKVFFMDSSSDGKYLKLTNPDDHFDRLYFNFITGEALTQFQPPDYIEVP